jgi:tryptophan-rich sensory protein
MMWFILLPLLVGTLLASFTSTNMYDTKPTSWAPPRWVFPVVWSVLYLCIGVAGYRVARLTKSYWSTPMVLWWIQMILNWAWTPIFFGLGQVHVALWVLRAIILSATAATVTFFNVDTLAGSLMIPYLLWLGVAHQLNLAYV